ncbi:MAG: hypothetical protein FJ294_10985 [Planctomycetes bacterium]|nr:hypothetical protein [Planctomycetota bacterium]
MVVREAAGAGRGGTLAWSRSSLLLQVFGVVGLVFLGAVLVTYLGTLPGLRRRFDLTAVGSNTLDERLAELVEKLPEPVLVEVFFRPFDYPLTRVGAQAQGRMSQLLHVARNQFPEKLKVREHDLADVAKVSVRMKELGLEEDNVVVVTRGKHKVVLRLLRDVARIDPGNPLVESEPTLEAFRGEEALGVALLRVSIEETPRIVFTVGHGERDLFDVEKPLAIGRLHSALVADGLRADRWDSSADPQVPADARVIAIVDPQQPFSSAELEVIERFVEDGGRLLLTTTGNAALFGQAGSPEALAGRLGIGARAGFVAQPIPDGFGGWRMGLEQCGTIVVAGTGLDRRHPVTESLWRADERVGLPNARALVPEGTRPQNSVLVDLLRSTEVSWRDLPQSGGRGDWRFDQRGEETGPFAVAMALAFPPADSRSDAEGERRAARVIVLGASDALSNDILGRNRDFVMNVFNWLAQRDYRLVIRPREVERRVLDLANTNALTLLNVLSFGVLPGLCAVLGVVVAFARRR